MTRLEKNRVYYGRSNADMINRVLGTSWWSKYYKCTVDLDRYGAEGVIAWFVFMDGSKHGYEDGWMWKNYLLNGGGAHLRVQRGHLRQAAQKGAVRDRVPPLPPRLHARSLRDRQQIRLPLLGRLRARGLLRQRAHRHGLQEGGGRFPSGRYGRLRSSTTNTP